MNRRLFLSVLLFCIILTMNAQIYTPGDTIQGSSGNNNVGIGTETPSNKLEVLFDVTSGSSSAIAQFGLAGSGAWHNSAHQVIIGGPSILDITGLIIYSDASTGYGALSFADGRGNSDSWRGFVTYDHSADALTLGSNATEKMRINSTGNVGIGTTNPISKLEVNGDFAAKADCGYVTAWGTGSEAQINILTDAGTPSRKYWRIGKGAAQDYLAIQLLSDDLGYVLKTPIIFNYDGNIGIGTTTPGNNKLNVAGKIRANEVVVNTTGADFVFEPDYKLPELHEIEKYIKENKRLPDFAPASEMKENGMNVSEMQTKLLQKIEELTLYLIEQEKKNARLEQEVKKLKELIVSKTE